MKWLKVIMLVSILESRTPLYEYTSLSAGDARKNQGSRAKFK